MDEAEETTSEPTAASAANAPSAPGAGPFRLDSGPPPIAAASVCRFLAIQVKPGSFGPPSEFVDPANRCIALGEPMAQAGRQQELVCLAAAHVNCPRYLRGVLLAGTPPPEQARRPIARAVIVASLVLAAAIAASFGFLAVRGGFSLPSAGPSTRIVAAATSSPSPTPASTAVVSSSPSDVPSLEPSLMPEPSPSPAPSATPTPAPPTASPTPRPSSDRYAVLTACPSTPDCWIYVIRAGDNLQSIAHWFGVSYDAMIAMNPGLRTPIHPGDRLKIPTPTR